MLSARSSVFTDEHKIVVKYTKSVFPASKQIMDKHNIICRSINGVDSKHLDSVEVYLSEYGFVEEPWLPHLSKHSHPLVDSDLPDALMDESKVTESKHIKEEIYFEENNQVEEPWLVQSLLHSPNSDPKSAVNVQSSEVSVVDSETPEESEGQDQKNHGKLLTISENDLISDKDKISTVILINSSICTMQRIAVLENGKLVELLLEPVKNNVQCDSIYLGVVTKLVPNMGGAFVNIGGHRPSLMDIKPYREPFLFPPICYQTKGKDTNESQCDKFADISNVMEETMGIKDHEMEDDSEEFMDDEFGDDHDNGESWEDPKGNYNGSVDSVGVEVEEDKYSDTASRNGQQPQGTDPDYPLKEDKVVCLKEIKWAKVQKGTKILVQVVKEELGTKGPTLTAYPKLRSRFWILISRCSTIGISKKISGVERTRLRVIAKTLQPPGFGVTVRTVAAGHSLEELQEDLEGLLSTWKIITEHAKSASFAADEGVDGAVPVMLHQAMGKTLSVVQDFFSEKVDSMIVDSPRIYHEVTNYLQEIAPDLCDRVKLYNRACPLFDEYKIEEEIDSILSKRVTLANGGYLVIEQTEALFSIDVNGGQCMLGKGTSKEKAILDVNLAAAKQIARELRLRDIGGIIVVDFIDMYDDSDKRLVYEEVKKAVERDRSTVKVSELSKYGLMEMTRKRVRPSVTFMISEQCSCCSGIGRVVALETSFSKIEHEICRLLSMMDKKANPEDPSSWPSFVLRVDQYMCNYLTSGKRTKLAVLSSSLKVWILLKVDRGFTRGSFDLKTVGEDDKDSKLQNKSAIPILRTREVGTNNFSRRVNLFPIKKWSTNKRLAIYVEEEVHISIYLSEQSRESNSQLTPHIHQPTMRALTTSSPFLSSIQQNLPNTFIKRYKTAPFQLLNPSTYGFTNKASSFRWRSTGVGGAKIQASAVPTSVPVRVAHDMIQAGHHYLDVRTPEEYSAGHPVGAVNVPYMFKVGSGMSKNPDFLDQVSTRFGKDDEIIVGCQAGKRSLMAATDLISAGYRGITDIAGGYAAWVQNGLPTEL